MSDLQTSHQRKVTVQVTQLNLNHCDAAQQLLYQSVAEWGTDIAIISDPYRVPAGNGNWVVDGSGKMAAIWTTGKYQGGCTAVNYKQSSPNNHLSGGPSQTASSLTRGDPNSTGRTRAMPDGKY